MSLPVTSSTISVDAVSIKVTHGKVPTITLFVLTPAGPSTADLKFPTTEDHTAPCGGWTKPANMEADDGVFATLSGPDGVTTSATSMFDAWGYAIPTRDSILAVEADLDWFGHGTSSQFVTFVFGSPGSPDNCSTMSPPPGYTTTQSDNAFGGPLGSFPGSETLETHDITNLFNPRFWSPNYFNNLMRVQIQGLITPSI